MKRVSFTVLVALLLFVSMVPMRAQQNRQGTINGLQDQIARLENDIRILNRQLQENSRSSEAALSSLSLVRRRISAREELIAQCDAAIRVMNDSIRLCQRRMDELQARHDTLSAYYNRLVRNAYKNRDSRKWYMYMLSSGSMGQAFRRFAYLRRFSSEMSSQAVKIRQTAAELEVERARLEALRAQTDDLRSQRVAERQLLQQEEAQAQQLVSQLQGDRRRYEQQLQAKNRQKAELNRRVQELIRQANEEARRRQQQQQQQGRQGNRGNNATAGRTTDTTIDATLSREFASNKGRLPWPVEGVIVERFGRHRHPVYSNVELPQNNGVTLAVTRGAQVKAVFAGTVSQIVMLPGYNQCVLVSHGSYFTLYAKLRTVNVHSGERVTIGQVIGTVDTIGGEDQFHFELWQGTTPLNPEQWLR